VTKLGCTYVSKWGYVCLSKDIHILTRGVGLTKLGCDIKWDMYDYVWWIGVNIRELVWQFFYLLV
jgi:hypothetical protein